MSEYQYEVLVVTVKTQDTKLQGFQSDIHECALPGIWLHQ